MAYETLLFAREEAFAVITLNRPPANVTSLSSQQRRMIAIASSVRRPRSLNGTPAARNSRSCSTPMPNAGSMRPCER